MAHRRRVSRRWEVTGLLNRLLEQKRIQPEAVLREAAAMRQTASEQRARSRELGRRTLELHVRSRRLRRRLTGPIFAMALPPEKTRSATAARVPSTEPFAYAPAEPLGHGDALVGGDGVPGEDGILLELDAHGFIVSCAPAQQPPTGHDPGDMLGHHLALLYGEEQVADFQPQGHLAAAVASGGLRVNGWLVRQNGERFWASMVLQPRFGEEGGVSGFVASVRENPSGLHRGAPLPPATGAARFEEMHSEIVKRLFRVGLTLYGARSLATQPEVRTHLEEAVEGLDGIIRYIRRSLWELGAPPPGSAAEERPAVPPQISSANDAG